MLTVSYLMLVLTLVEVGEDDYQGNIIYPDIAMNFIVCKCMALYPPWDRHWTHQITCL